MWSPCVLGLTLLAAIHGVEQTSSPVSSDDKGAAVVSEQGPPAISDQVASLRETLEKGLRARLPEEFQYIDRVVTLVDQGVLPLSLVLSTFKWARKQHQVYPFVYFKLGLRERAGKLGIPL